MAKIEFTEEQKEQEAFLKKRRRYRPDSDSEDEEDSGGYEGAIVLPPNPGIYLETPITVLDYSSLYPSSMISENLSHDTYVMDPKYDNLPGVIYKDTRSWEKPSDHVPIIVDIDI